MRIVSILEDQQIEKRIAITPEIAKKYVALGFEVSLPENYGLHLGINDNQFKELGVAIIKDEKEILNNADIIVQLGLLNDNQSSILKQNQRVRTETDQQRKGLERELLRQEIISPPFPGN